ncbi:UNVERIFIED_CONTAM: hypothetical protein NCL1_19244 [Trichonephila clavipes]
MKIPLYSKTAEFELKSPGYPTDAYADDLSCRYRVMKSSPSVCELMITILDFKLQEGEVCENDYLQIAEERLCGTIESGMTRCPSLKYPKVMAYYYGTTHQNM